MNTRPSMMRRTANALPRLGMLPRLGAMPRVLPSAASVFILTALLLMVLAPGGSAAFAAPAVSSVPSQTLCAQTLWLLSELQSELETTSATRHYWSKDSRSYQPSAAEFAALTDTQSQKLSSTHSSFFDTSLHFADECSPELITPHIFARQTPVVAQIESSLSSHEAAFLCGARPHQFLE